MLSCGSTQPSAGTCEVPGKGLLDREAPEGAAVVEISAAKLYCKRWEGPTEVIPEESTVFSFSLRLISNLFIPS